jgi:hypothetical protein
LFVAIVLTPTATLENTKSDPLETDPTALEIRLTKTGYPPGNNLESAIVMRLNPSAFTVALEGSSGPTGVGLIEISEYYPRHFTIKPFISPQARLILALVTCAITPAAIPPIPNLSSRTDLRAPGDTLITGFVVSTPYTQVLLRAIGPSLTQFGVSHPLADPVLALYDSAGNLIAEGFTYGPPPPGIIRVGFPPNIEQRSGAFPVIGTTQD